MDQTGRKYRKPCSCDSPSFAGAIYISPDEETVKIVGFSGIGPVPTCDDCGTRWNPEPDAS